ncbi:cobyrinate a,c-diamide synthase [Bacteroides oleiciplenus]|uniref:Cobyrinic acid a,c-diamide synthase n=1 Tax=Bacteroides oleiciplenus YIT 12058 TaxID=742727 RepID=K9E7W4_9BACE|nr:cobyrinic acid a,c-diamide synthase [Bacteroides oleiciplenus YIT 12058]
MMRNIPQFLIAAPTSGTGKTTISRLLMALLTKRGLRVQPFKCGPDYIDTKYHERACGIPSYNLDLFMASGQHVRTLYVRHAAEADVCIVEGMMGMFDGYDRSKGSSADIAKELHLPVVMVINAKSAAYSLAAMIKGYMDFDPKVQVIGVIFNQVASDRHEVMLREICEDLNIFCFGCLRTNSALKEESRHLGLDFSRGGKGGISKTLLKSLEKQLDCDLLLQMTERVLNIPRLPYKRKTLYLNTWVACNKESFSFIYAEHIYRLKEYGQVTFFDPEDKSVVLPDDVNFLYLPGGYPENRVKQLSGAANVLDSIRQYIERGGRALAECGGMMYLSSAIIKGDEHPVSYKMADVLPIKVSVCKKDAHLSLGYRRFVMRGVEVRGHEFHYSQVVEQDEDLTSAVQMYNARKQLVDTPVYRYKNLIASYTHLYFGEISIMHLFDEEV